MVTTIASQISKQSQSGPRPMLARDADSMYWMSRYVERVEHIARMLQVNASLLTDVADLGPILLQRQWGSILRVMHVEDPPAGKDSIGRRIAQYMMFGHNNPNSILTCLTHARENARAIRENISTEMWESINTLYWSISADDAPARFEDAPDDMYNQLTAGSMLFQGLTDQTLAHDQGWLFTLLGKFVERVDVTCRLLETKWDILGPSETGLETPIRNIHWMAVLRSCCSLETYRRRNMADMDPVRIAAFLILETNFPRSIRFSVGKAHEAMTRIRAEINPRSIDAAERILGRLHAQLNYMEMPDILTEGLAIFLQRIQEQVGLAVLAVQKAYFLH